MLLAVDIGNTSIKFGLFEGETLTSRLSIPTRNDLTADDVWNAVGERVSSGVDLAIACSVVPSIDAAMRSFLTEVSGGDLARHDPIFVTNSSDFGLKITYAPLGSLGTDRLVNAFAAVEKYGAPVIACSLGTATTIDVVNSDREFVGGMIAPGLQVLSEALHIKAPRLPEVRIDEPPKLIGNSTDDAVRAGIYHGYVAMVEGLITRVQSQVGITRVIGTGGNAERLSKEFAAMMRVDSDLLLEGLSLMARKAI